MVDDARVRSVRGIVLEQKGVEGDRHHIVDGDDLDVWRALDERLERLAADAAEAIDANAGSHRSLLVSMPVRRTRSPWTDLAANGPRSTFWDRSPMNRVGPSIRGTEGDL